MPRKKKPTANIRKDTSYKAKGVAKTKKRQVKNAVPKTRNAGTMTESQYFQRIRSALRNAFRYWKPMLKALEEASRPCKGCAHRLEYQCANCKKWFARRQVEIDHIEECGSLSCWEDVVPFIQRLTREELEAYQIMCKPCHKEKTKSYANGKAKKAA